MKILIVAKTHMSKAFCIGAYDMEKKRNIRLLTLHGDNQPLNTKFDVGQIWDIDYIDRVDIKAPHMEDVLLQKSNYLKNIKNISDYLDKNVPIWKGDPSNIFEGKITFPIGKSGFLEGHKNISQSVGFWLPDKNLELTILKDKKHYLYFGKEQVYSFPYVGATGKVENIPKNTLLRVSLTRWWSPNPREIKKSCYCQLSGWFDLQGDIVNYQEANEYDLVY